MKEQWVIFNDETNITYECSNLGRFKRNGKMRVSYLKPYKRSCVERKNHRNRAHTVIIKISVKGLLREYNCKKLLAEKFIRPLKPDEVVITKNNNDFDLRIENLFITTKQNLGKITGHKSSSKKVNYYDSTGFRHTYRSARLCSKELGISYRTILRYLHNKIVDPKFNVEFVEE